MTTRLDAATDRYAVVTTSQGTALLCFDCLLGRKMAISYNPHDVQHHYCGSCKRFLDDLLADAPPPAAAADESARLQGWLKHIRWGVGFYEPDSPTKVRVLVAVDAALAGQPVPGADEPAATDPTVEVQP